MVKKLLPLILLLLGSGAGVAAGILLRPGPEQSAGPEMVPDAGGAADQVPAGGGGADPGEYGDDGTGLPMEYVKLNNQFVVPVVKDQKVEALVVLSLSLEVPEGSKDAVFRVEPKLRDSFLQVLFDHANIGGFEGAFTAASNMNVLRNALREAAQRDMDVETIRDVLILEIARQDY